MNRINPRKLPGSKWTAVAPSRREKHYLVSAVEFDEDDSVVSCTLEAVISNRAFEIDWRELKDNARWLQGWK